VAGVKFFLDFWKLSNFTNANLFLSTIHSLAEADDDTQRSMSKAVSLLLPALVAVKEAPETSKKAIFDLFASTVAHPALHLPHATPYPPNRAAKNKASLWDSPAWSGGEYQRETEAYKCVLLPLAGESYELNPESVNLTPFLNLIFSTLTAPIQPLETIALLLNPDVIFRNSQTLAMAIRTIELMKKNCENQKILFVFIESLCEIAKTRTGSVPVASTGLWKFALQTLLSIATPDIESHLRNALIPLLPTGEAEADPIDYKVFDFCARQGGDIPDLVAYVEEQLSRLAQEHDLFRMHILLAVLKNCEGEKKFSPEQFLPRLIASISGLFARCDSCESAVAAVLDCTLPKPLVTGCWNAMAANLITTESKTIRNRVKTLLLAYPQL